MSRILELAPAFWQQTLQQEDAQQRLAANVFRAVTLAEREPPVPPVVDARTITGFVRHA